MSVHRNKKLLVCASFVALVVVAACVLSERDNDPAARTKNESLSSHAICRKTPAVSHCKLTSSSLERIVALQISSEGKMNLLRAGEMIVSGTSPAELASEKNQVMDKLLNQPQVPSDYGDVMIGLYRDKSQDVLTRDFAVQHIGLYAQALERRGEYDAEAAESRKLRSALFDAAGETRTIIAAAAFRARADMSVFDPKVDTNRLDSLLAACTADAFSDPASRAMAVQLCGERRVRPSRPALEAISGIPSTPAVLRLSARRALSLIDGKELAQ